MTEIDFAAFGKPDIRVAGLSLWIRGRQFPHATDYWDGNWLQSTAYCQYPGARIWIQGPFLRTDEIGNFASECERFAHTLTGDAALECLEPYLRVHLSGNSHGHVRVTISLTSDPVHQRHEFEDEIDQTQLREIATACRAVLARCPTVSEQGPESHR